MWSKDAPTHCIHLIFISHINIRVFSLFCYFLKYICKLILTIVILYLYFILYSINIYVLRSWNRPQIIVFILVCLLFVFIHTLPFLASSYGNHGIWNVVRHASSQWSWYLSLLPNITVVPWPVVNVNYKGVCLATWLIRWSLLGYFKSVTQREVLYFEIVASHFEIDSSAKSISAESDSRREPIILNSVGCQMLPNASVCSDRWKTIWKLSALDRHSIKGSTKSKKDKEKMTTKTTNLVVTIVSLFTTILIVNLGERKAERHDYVLNSPDNLSRETPLSNKIENEWRWGNLKESRYENREEWKKFDQEVMDTLREAVLYRQASNSWSCCWYRAIPKSRMWKDENRKW